ncbi:hypothetical protein GE09DRAFT_1172048 [Coniochaeta sp. 2T2.1]|nr:hypothetical protein GE09DRAFT_1172048 [Coniochaeta sp. 2T2.1]
MDSLTTNTKVQFAATAIVSAAVAATAVLSLHRLQHHESSKPRRSKPAEVPDDDAPPKAPANLDHMPLLTNADKEDVRNAELAKRALAGDFDNELILEQLARNRVFLTPEGLDKLRSAFVVVVGCGGVGSHCAAALARSGVGRLRFIDFDQVTLSSLNRHAVATLSDVGLSKVQCLRRRLQAITPWVGFDLCLEKFDAQVADRLLGNWEDGQKPDFVVDAIDNIESKVELLKYCHDHKLPVISSMGAGCKSDPTRIVVGDIGTSTDDGLSRATRRRLKLKGVTSGIPVVYSTEQEGAGKAKLLPLPDEEFQKGKVGELGALPDFRVRILPVLGTMPAVFGYTVANHVMCSISGYPIDYVPGKARDKMYDGILAFVQSSEEKIVRREIKIAADEGLGLKIPLNPGDIAFLVEDLYKGKSVVTGLPTKLVLIRWKKPVGSAFIRIGEGDDEQKSSNISLHSLVCMTKEEAVRHQKEILLGDKSHAELYSQETIELVAAKLEEAREYEKYRR